jgi:2-furoate---CoA ligase
VTLATLLARAARRHPDAEAVIDGPRRLTYHALDALTASAARGFAQLGVAKGDRVLLSLRNRLEHVVAYWALQKLAAIPVPANFRLAANELRYVLDDSAAKVAVFEASTADAMLEAANGTLTRLVFVGESAAGATFSPDVLRFDGLLGDGGRGWGGGGGGGGGGAPRAKRCDRASG